MGEILAVRLPNWVGDVVMALPALQRLAEGGFALRLFGRKWAGDLLAGCPWPVEALPSGTWAAGRAMAASGARRGVAFPNSLGSALAMRLAGIRVAGYRGDGRSLLLSLRLSKDRGRHEVEVFYGLAAAVASKWGAPPPLEKAGRSAEANGGGRLSHAGPAPLPRVATAGDAPPLRPGDTVFAGLGPRIGLPLSDRHRDQADEALRAGGVSGVFAAVCPLAHGQARGRPKVWPGWREFCEKLTRRGIRLVACPGPGEAAACRETAPGAVVLDGLSLGAYAAVLSLARAVAANDSGPMHLADAAGAPTLGIFGVSDPGRTRPWGGRFLGSADAWPTVPEVLAAFGPMVEPAAAPE